MPRKKLFGGIYQIRNLINQKRYIGQSVNLHKRKCEHFSALKNNRHKNKHLQSAYNLYGEEKIVFETILYCEPFELTRYEQYFESFYKQKNESYNTRECVDSNKGIVWSEEVRKKMSDSAKGKVISEETRKKISDSNKGEKNYLYGKHHSEEMRKKLSENHVGFKGKTHSEETKKKMSESSKGRHCTEETKKRISEAKKGKPSNRKGSKHTEESKKKMSESLSGEKHPMYGKHIPDEQKRKMSESRKLWWRKKKGLLDEPDNDGII